MVYVRICNKTDEKHLHNVMEEMKEMGSPTIRIIDTGDEYIALEGSHRLHAAKELGIKVIFKVMKETQVISNHDIDDLPKKAKAGKIAEYVADSRLSLKFSEDEYEIA